MQLLFVCSLCRCATWPLTLSDLHTLRVFENRVPRFVWTWEGRSNRRLDNAACWGNLWSVSFIKYCLGVEIKENLMCGEKEMCTQVVSGETWSEDSLEELDIDGKIILTWVLKKLNIKTRAVVTVLTLWRRNYFFLISAHPVYKMWIIQEPNKLALWNKLRFEEKKKTESTEHV